MLRKSQKQTREDLRRKNFKRECEELNKVGELLREVLNIRSSVKLDMLCLANASCHNLGPVILWVRHLSFTCIDKCHITWHKGGAVWFSINHGWTHAHAQSENFQADVCVTATCLSFYMQHWNKQMPLLKQGYHGQVLKWHPLGCQINPSHAISNCSCPDNNYCAYCGWLQ